MITATTYRHHHHSKYKFCCSMLASQMEQCIPNCRMNLRWKGKYNRKWNNEFKWAWTCGKPSNLSQAKVHERLDVGACSSAECGAPQDDTKIGIISRKMRSNSLPGLIQFPASKRHKHRHQGHNPSANLILRDKIKCACTSQLVQTGGKSGWWTFGEQTFAILPMPRIGAAAKKPNIIEAIFYRDIGCHSLCSKIETAIWCLKIQNIVTKKAQWWVHECNVYDIFITDS